MAGEKGSADTVQDIRDFAGIEKKGKMIYKSIKKNIGFGLLAIFGYYLVCFLLPSLANAQASIITPDKYITQAAKDVLQKFQDN